MLPCSIDRVPYRGHETISNGISCSGSTVDKRTVIYLLRARGDMEQIWTDPMTPVACVVCETARDIKLGKFLGAKKNISITQRHWDFILQDFGIALI